MPSRPQLKTSGVNASAMPFASYAQVLRMLMPPAHRVGFYDAKGHALWVSDGVEEPEFRMHLDLVLARFAANRPEEMAGPYSATEQPEPIYVFPIRDSAGNLLGAVGLLCRSLPEGTAYRRPEHVDRLLAPLLDIVSHGWRTQVEPPQPPVLVREIKATNPIIAPAPAPPADAPLPALLRRTLALATRSLNGAFGTVIAAARPFTLTHRVSPDESDLAIDAAIDNVRTSVLRYMSVRTGPLVSNITGTGLVRTDLAGTGRAQQLPYKLLALPLRTESSQLAAALVVFRARNAPDFTGDEVASLAKIAAQVPANLLRELIPSAVTVAPAIQPAAATSANPEHLPEATAATTKAPPEASKLAPATPEQPPSIKANPTPLKIVQLAAAHSAMTMDERVRAALREDNFDLYVQKISPLRDTRRAARYEVLLRMTDGTQLYAPQTFFAAAEANELMPELDQWVIRELMSTLRKRAAALRTNFWEFSINIAAQTLLTDQFSEYVLQELRSSAIPAGLLVFEVAESDAIEHQYSLSILAKRLHEAGCRLALDNCRAGLRTFDSVHKWPVSCLKIDGSLIRNIVTNYRYETQVRAVAEMAREMRIETVAECVESEGIRERLIGMGVDYAQGFHFGKPQPLRTLFRD
jgi:EAL domain-containing protein (putative c-di-GMP-specific phosphodiesterase class I)